MHTEVVGNVRVGQPQIEPSAASHTKGVSEGNQRKHTIREAGIRRAGRFMAQATVRRSTGVNAHAHTPIDPRMPLLTPA